MRRLICKKVYCSSGMFLQSRTRRVAPPPPFCSPAPLQGPLDPCAEALLASGRKVSFQGPLLTVNRHPIDQLTDQGTLPADDSIRDRAIRVVSLFCRRREKTSTIRIVPYNIYRLVKTGRAATTLSSFHSSLLFFPLPYTSPAEKNRTEADRSRQSTSTYTLED